MTCIIGNCLDVLPTIEAGSVQCVVTSPPYWGLRDYGVAGQLGLEATPTEFVARMVDVFREVRRVLRDDGTLWLNLGDSYYGGNKGNSGPLRPGDKQSTNIGSWSTRRRDSGTLSPTRTGGCSDLKVKDLCGIPWRVAFALQADGWYLRSEITWCKRSPMPESVTDRPTSATEKIFLLTKSESYFYDADSVRNPPSVAMLRQVAEGYNGHATKLFEGTGAQDASGVKSRIIEGARKRVDKQRGHSRRHAGFNDRWDSMTKEEQMACGSNMRNYWLVGPEPYPEGPAVNRVMSCLIRLGDRGRRVRLQKSSAANGCRMQRSGISDGNVAKWAH